MRPPREPDGSFTKDVEIRTWDGWEEVGVGDTVVRDVALGLDMKGGWKGFLEKGRRYWMRYDNRGVGMLGLDRY